jgi:hypothetical protein
VDSIEELQKLVSQLPMYPFGDCDFIPLISYENAQESAKNTSITALIMIKREVCGFREKGLCATGDGCVPGTDSQAPEKLEKFKETLGPSCLLLECAITKKVNHCTQCDEFACKTHYKQGFPYNTKLLDMLEGML